MKSVLTKKRLQMRVVFGIAAVALTASAALSFVPAAAKPHRVVCVQIKQGNAPLKSQPMKPQVDLEVTMENNPEVVAGEPIVLHYTITNSSQLPQEAIAADFGADYAKVGTLKLLGEDGTALHPLPQPTHHLPTSAFSAYGGILNPNQSHDGFVVVTQQFAPPPAGKYTLTVTVDVPYARYNPYGERQLIDFGNLRGTGLAIQGKYTFPITVREAKQDDLVDVANKLRKRFVASRDAKQKERLATALFSMSSNEVLPVWKRLAYESTASDRPIVAKALAQTLKLEAADVLVKMEMNHPAKDNAGNPVSVMRTISDMSLAGIPELTKHIKNLLVPYRLTLPVRTLSAD